jgi:hypothetical protein
MTARPPTIPPSTNYDNNFSTLLKVDNLQSDIITDNNSSVGALVIANGTITNLDGPFLNDLDVVNKNYIQPASAGGVLYSVQYNDQGFFNGSENLLFNDTSLELTGTFTDNTCSITTSTSGTGIITGINDPINDSDACSKQYADKYINYYTQEISNGVSHVYTPREMINSYIKRATTTIVEDQTATAADIVAYLESVFITISDNSSFTFALLNTGSNEFTLTGGTGVTIESSNFTLCPNYVLLSTIIIASTSSALVTMSIDSISVGTNYISSFFNKTGSKTYLSTQFPYKVNEILLGPTMSTAATTSTEYTYTISDIKSGLIVRDPAADASDTFAQLTDENCSFVIQNISGNAITITPTVRWNFSTVTIPANNTGYFWTRVSSSTSFTLITIGIS